MNNIVMVRGVIEKDRDDLKTAEKLKNLISQKDPNALNKINKFFRVTPKSNILKSILKGSDLIYRDVSPNQDFDVGDVVYINIKSGIYDNMNNELYCCTSGEIVENNLSSDEVLQVLKEEGLPEDLRCIIPVNACVYKNHDKNTHQLIPEDKKFLTEKDIIWPDEKDIITRYPTELIESLCNVYGKDNFKGIAKIIKNKYPSKKDCSWRVIRDFCASHGIGKYKEGIKENSKSNKKIDFDELANLPVFISQPKVKAKDDDNEPESKWAPYAKQAIYEMQVNRTSFVNTYRKLVKDHNLSEDIFNSASFRSYCYALGAYCHNHLDLYWKLIEEIAPEYYEKIKNNIQEDLNIFDTINKEFNYHIMGIFDLLSEHNLRLNIMNDEKVKLNKLRTDLESDITNIKGKENLLRYVEKINDIDMKILEVDNNIKNYINQLPKALIECNDDEFLKDHLQTILDLTK